MSTIPPPYGSDGGLNQPPGGFPSGGFPASQPSGGKQKKERAPKGDKTATKRVVSTSRLLVIAAAVAVIVLVGALILLSSDKSTWVVVAKQPVPALSTVSPSELQAVKAPANLVVQDAFKGSSASAALKSAEKAINGMRTTVPLALNAQLQRSNFGTSLADVALQSGDVLASVNTGVANAVGGALQVGDYVDVASGGTNGGGGTIVASGVKIVGVRASLDQYNAAAAAQGGGSRTASPDELLPTHPVPGIYILQTTTDQATAIANAQLSGSVYLIYVNSPTTTPSGGSGQ